MERCLLSPKSVPGCGRSILQKEKRICRLKRGTQSPFSSLFKPLWPGSGLSCREMRRMLSVTFGPSRGKAELTEKPTSASLRWQLRKQRFPLQSHAHLEPRTSWEGQGGGVVPVENVSAWEGTSRLGFCTAQSCNLTLLLKAKGAAPAGRLAGRDGGLVRRALAKKLKTQVILLGNASWSDKTKWLGGVHPRAEPSGCWGCAFPTPASRSASAAGPARGPANVGTFHL